MRRVVVTGLGLVTPLASGVEETWARLLDGQSGAGPITLFDAQESGVATTYACEVPRGDGTDGSFNPDDWVVKKDQKKIDDFILYGIAAAEMAVKDADWTPEDEESLLRTGVMIGSGIGGLSSIADTAVMIKEKGPRRVSPFFIPGALINLISGQVSIRHGFKGPNHSVVTACSTGAHAIGDASRLIKSGDADVMIAGGAEAAICEIGWIDLDVQSHKIENPVTFFVDRGQPITAATRSIHHISDLDVEGAVSPADAVRELHAGMAPTDIFCAHNSKFEKAFLGNYRRWICTLKAAYRCWPEFARHNNQFLRYQLELDELPDFNSEAAMPPHRALPDAITTAFILRHQLVQIDVTDLVACEQQPSILPRMPIGKHRGKSFKEVAEIDRGYLDWIVKKSGMDPKKDEDLIATAKFWLNGGA